MIFLEQYYKTIILYDLINKFQYNNIKKIPKLKKINLGLKIKPKELTIDNTLATTFILGFITNQPGIFATTKKAQALFKIRKGYPIGSKVVLKKISMYNFFLKLVFNIFPRIKSFYGLFLTKEKLINSFSFKLKTRLLLYENNSVIYNEYLRNLPFYTNISFVANTNNKKELKFLLFSYKLPLIQL